MYNLFEEVKKFKVVLKAEVNGIVPSYKEGNTAVWRRMKDERFLFSCERSSQNQISFEVVEENSDTTVVDEVKKTIEFDSILSDINGVSLFRILGFGTANTNVSYKMADDLEEQEFVFSREEYDSKTKEYTIFLATKDKVYRKIEGYEERRKRMEELGELFAEETRKEEAERERKFKESIEKRRQSLEKRKQGTKFLTRRGNVIGMMNSK